MWPAVGDNVVLVDRVGDELVDKIYVEKAASFPARYAAIENSNVWLRIFAFERDDDKMTARECYRRLFGPTKPSAWEYFVTQTQKRVPASSTTQFLEGPFIRIML